MQKEIPPNPSNWYSKEQNFLSTSCCFFLIPLVLEADYVLGLWLKEVPPYAPFYFEVSTICSFG